MLSCYGVIFSFGMLFARVFFVFVVVGGVVHMSLTNAIFVALTDQFYESIL